MKKKIIIAIIAALVISIAGGGAYAYHRSQLVKAESKLAKIEAQKKEQARKEAQKKKAEKEAADNAKLQEAQKQAEMLKALEALANEQKKQDTSANPKTNNADNNATQPATRRTLVCIDPGHGGAVGCHYNYDGIEVQEKDLNWAIACKLKSYLEANGVPCIMTRSGDYDVSLAARVDYAKRNGATYFVSIHNNATADGDYSDHGSMVIATQSGYNACYDKSNAIARSVMSQLQGLGLSIATDFNVAATGGILHRTDSSTYPDGSRGDYYGIIRHATNAGIPAVIIEHAYLSNESDYRNYLSNDAQLDALARADCSGILAAIR